MKRLLIATLCIYNMHAMENQHQKLVGTTQEEYNHAAKNFEVARKCAVKRAQYEIELFIDINKAKTIVAQRNPDLAQLNWAHAILAQSKVALEKITIYNCRSAIKLMALKQRCEDIKCPVSVTLNNFDRIIENLDQDEQEIRAMIHPSTLAQMSLFIGISFSLGITLFNNLTN